MDFISPVHRRPVIGRRSVRAVVAALGLIGLSCTRSRRTSRPGPDPSAVHDDSRISATIEFGLPALASEIERDFPGGSPHRRAGQLRTSARAGFQGQRQLRHLGLRRTVRTGFAVWPRRPRLRLRSIHGALEGQGANRFTARIHGETEASATIEAEARPN